MSLARRLRSALVLVVVTVVPVAVAAATSPEETVERLHRSLVEVMKQGDALGFPERRDHLAPTIDRVYDLSFITRIVMGRHWRDLDADERRRMEDVFRRLTIATYADRFDGHSGESFVTKEVQETRRGHRLVRTQLERPDDDAVSLHYLLRESNGQWRIINVIANGVSDLALKRADYNSIMEREGFETLISRLEEQVDELGAGG